LISLVITVTFAQGPQAIPTETKKIASDFQHVKDRGIDHQLLAIVQKHRELTRITEVPHEMHPNVSAACDISDIADVHGNRYCDVFISPDSAATILSGHGSYKPGTVIVKSKYPSKTRESIELFTVMKKMEPGYSSDNGDWQYTVVDSTATQILAQGRIESCSECHRDYKNTDFVTRIYLK
jgi:hypothetical protein